MALPISKITGVGPHTVNVLMEHGYTSVESIANTKIVDLTQVPGFGIARARNIIAAAKTLLEKSESGSKAKKAKAKKPSKKKKGTKKKDKKATKKTKKEEKIKTKKKTSPKDKKKKSEKAKKKKKASTKKKK